MFLSKISIRSCINHTSHRRIKHFRCYCLQAFSTEEILKRHIEDCFKISSKQRIIMPKKGEYVKFKTYERKRKLPFMIYIQILKIY